MPNKTAYANATFLSLRCQYLGLSPSFTEGGDCDGGGSKTGLTPRFRTFLLLPNWQISLLRRCLLLRRGAFPRLLFSPRNHEDRSTVPVAAAPLTSPAMRTIANTCTTCTQMLREQIRGMCDRKKSHAGCDGAKEYWLEAGHSQTCSIRLQITHFPRWKPSGCSSLVVCNPDEEIEKDTGGGDAPWPSGYVDSSLLLLK